MGFLLGRAISPASSPLLSSHRKSTKKKKNPTPMASLHRERYQAQVYPKFSNSRRSFLFVGISTLHFLQMKAAGAADIVKEKKDKGNGEEQKWEMSSQEFNQSEQVSMQEAPGNSSISLFNELGILVSGVLGALYLTSQKETADMEATIESMKMKLSEKDAAVASLKEDFERRLLKEQEQKKQVRKLEAEEASLSSQIGSAKGIITALGRELHSQKKLVEELKVQISKLECAIIQAGEDKTKLVVELRERNGIADVLQDRVTLLTFEINEKEKSIKNLNLLLAEKELELKNLSSAIDYNKAQLLEAKSTVERLQQEIFEAKNDVNSLIDQLTSEIESLRVEEDDINQKFRDLSKEYDALKSACEQRTTLDSELLSKKDDQLHLLEEKLGFALNKISNDETMISQMMKESDGAKALLEKEASSIEKLKNELHTTKMSLAASNLETSNLAKELKDVRRSYEDLMSKSSKLEAEFEKANKSLNGNLEEANFSSIALSGELTSIKEVLERTNEELAITSKELKTMIEDREKLKGELMEIYSKLETTAQELREEKSVSATLNKELEVLGKQMREGSEARNFLEADLEEATKSLDELNKSTLLISRELENTNSIIASLETEKEMLFQSAMEQKNLAKEAEENIEDAHKLIMRLGSERENLEKRTKTLESELASAKGEILRLRRQISLRKKSADGQHTKPRRKTSSSSEEL